MRWIKVASLVVLGLVLALFALMGLLYATRDAPTRAVRAFGDPAGPPAAAASLFLRTMQVLTQTQLSEGNSVAMLLNGDGTYPRLYADLRSARRSITLQLYYCKPGAVADSIKTILRERAHAGVRVLFLLDAFGAQNLQQPYLDSLTTAGVRSAQFRPLSWHTLHKAQNRSHVRAVVIDETVAYTGGFGMADYWLGDGHHEEQWRDSNVRFTGPAVLQTQAAFAIAWAEATGELLTGRFLFGTPVPRDSGHTQLAGLLFTQSTLGSTTAERFMALSMAGARKRLYISNSYFVPDKDQEAMLIRAVRRGADVRILTAGKKTDVRTVRHAGHARYERLLRGGVRIYEYQPTMLHAKTMVVDGIWSTIGTMNFDNRSLALNDESNLVVHDSVFGRQMEQQFRDDLRYSQEFTLRHFEQRSFLYKLLDSAASQIAKLL